MKISKRYTWISIGGHVVVILIIVLFSSTQRKDEMIEPIQVLEAEPAPMPVMPAPPIQEEMEEKAKLEEVIEEVPVEKKPEIDPSKRKVIPKPKPKPKPKPVIKPLPEIKPALEDKLKTIDDTKPKPVLNPEKKN